MIFWEKRRGQKHIASLIPATPPARSTERRPALQQSHWLTSLLLPLTVMGLAFCFTYLEIWSRGSCRSVMEQREPAYHYSYLPLLSLYLGRSLQQPDLDRMRTTFFKTGSASGHIMGGLGLVKEQVYVTGIRIVGRLRAEEALDRLGWRHGSLLACLVGVFWRWMGRPALETRCLLG
jgi:hypothetical protein